MPLKKIYFQIDEDSENYPKDSEFSFETNYITEYISRDIAKEKYKYKNAIKLIIYVDSNKQNIEYEDLFKSIICHLPIKYKDIDYHVGERRTEKILEQLLIASNITEQYTPGITDKIRESIARFIDDKYKNIWVFHQRTIKGIGKVILECELNKNNFILYFLLKINGTEVFREEIIREMPDSLCYHHKFNKMIIDDEHIIIPDRMNGTTFKIGIDVLKGISKEDDLVE